MISDLTVPNHLDVDNIKMTSRQTNVEQKQDHSMHNRNKTDDHRRSEYQQHLQRRS
jgi:hypothetical protein